MEQTAQTKPPKAKRRFARASTGDTVPTVKAAPTTPKAKGKVGTGKSAALSARVTKADIVIGLLARPAGATIAQMCEATGWQQHSVRGFLSGTVKKKPGMTLSSDKTEAGRTYRLTTDVAVPA